MGPHLFRYGKWDTSCNGWASNWLQWGHIFSDMERQKIEQNALNVLRASMGPHLFRYGKAVLIFGILIIFILGFNGATSFQIWKEDDEKPSKKRKNKLQWGHIFSDMERSRKLNPTFRFISASMGPHLFRYGKYIGDEYHGREGGASMGPHLFRYGKESQLTRGVSGQLTLQWGHIFSDMERNYMFGKKSDKSASMGPHLFRYGKSICFPGTTKAARLQWGHIFSDMERSPITVLALP